MIKVHLKEVLASILSPHYPEIDGTSFIDIETPKHDNQGDYSTTMAFRLAKHLKKSPLHIANDMVTILQKSDETVPWDTCVAEKGFVNLTLSSQFLYTYVPQLLSKKPLFPQLGPQVLLEYVSANPTGPLHIGHGRWAVLGDCMDRLCRYTQHNTASEFYINDAGNQITLFRQSVEACRRNAPVPESGYQGEYVTELAQRAEDPVETMISQQQEVLKSLGVTFDTWFSEQSIATDTMIQDVLATLKKQDLIAEKDGAVWFLTTRYGDDKDRVLVKSDGRYTYFLMDCVYHASKIARGYQTLITVLGADHHGYVKRLTAAVTALCSDQTPCTLQVVIGQLVSLFRNGEPVRMSKRSGDIILLEDVIDEIGKDATRFYLIHKSADTHLEFDLQKAVAKNAQNPVYYIQYAHARMSALLRAFTLEQTHFQDVSLISKPERQLIWTCASFYDTVAEATTRLAPYKLAAYAAKLAKAFHVFYETSPIKTESDSVQQHRLLVVATARDILAETLALLGLTAPERM